MRGWFSCEYEPVESVEPGASVTFQALGAFWSWDADVEPQRPEGAGHALYGPIEVRGARAGQTLSVRIDEVVPRNWGRTWAPPGETFAWTLEGDTWRLGPHAVRSAPFLGVIGMPPPEPGEHSTTPPRRWGGNIDCKELVAGTTLYLPIPVDGALLMAGDGHGAQGDGEVSGTAIECPLERVTLTLDVADRDLRSPIARTRESWIAFGFEEDLDAAAEQATETMLDLMEGELGVSRPEARALASVCVDLRVTQVVNEVKGVHAVLRDDAIR
ncbi:MAG TPA: acetamidase/formamidase family protein [Gaiellaceae bacterium]